MWYKLKKNVPTTIIGRYFVKILLLSFLMILLLIYFQILQSNRDHAPKSYKKTKQKLNKSKVNQILVQNLEYEIDAFNRKKSIKTNNEIEPTIKIDLTTTINQLKPIEQVQPIDFINKKKVINQELGNENQILNRPFDINKYNNNRPPFINNNLNNPNPNFNPFINNLNQMQPNQPVIVSHEQIQQELDQLEKIVHLDLKGAPPKISYLEKFIPLLKENGATGVLLEYEDMFPFEGKLAQARHGNAYSLDDIKRIKELCANNSLKIMPLVQTYGHLEWILKLDTFKHLRDNSEYPQVITQCLNESYSLIFDMLDQVINQHKDVPYFHIGCDEVYYKLTHPSCANTSFNYDFNEAFMSHLVRIAGYIKLKLPQAKIIFWHDMLNNMPELIYEKYKPLITQFELEPMIWAYVLDLKTWFTGNFFHLYGKNYPYIWAATAYKGASGELATFTNIQERNQNHKTWIEAILENHSKKVVKFRGLALTGWSRYDHFLALCELLPQAIPSLVFNLATVSSGTLTQEKISKINNDLGCIVPLPWTLEEAEYRYGSMSCKFPGNEIYKLVVSFAYLVKNVEKDLDFAKKYMSPTNVIYKYLHKARADEALTSLEVSYSNLVNAKNNFINEAEKIYWDETVKEWLLVHVYPHMDAAYKMIKTIKDNKDTQAWKPRPLNITLKDYPNYVVKNSILKDV